LAAGARRFANATRLDDAAPVGEGSLRTDVLGGLPKLLRELGVPPGELFASLGIAPRLLDDPHNELPFSALGPLLGAAAERTACPHFGLLLGARVRLASLGLVGRLAAAAPDVGTALRDLCDHMPVRDRGAVISISSHGGSAALGYALYSQGLEGAPGSDQIYDTAMAIGANLLRDLCGPDASPTQALLCRGEPADPRPWRRYFGAPVHFDADRTEIVFPAKWLGRRLRGADAAQHRSLEARVREVESRAVEDLVAGLRRALRTRLLGGKVCVGEVARMLAVHRRTLNRRMETLHTSVHDVAEELRFEVARQLVGSTAMPLIEIAASLGYADASGFTRAFRRWSGSTPSAWRKRRRNGHAAPAAGAR
jgi:AraC-like DNA-binding protein